MDIRQLRVVVRARNFERTSRFYAEVLGLPRVDGWEREDSRAAVYQAGDAAIEVRARAGAATRGLDEAYDYQGPDHKMTITLVVPSAHKAYEVLLHRDKNIPGGLSHDDDGALLFSTHDPDGVRIAFREAPSLEAERERALATPSAHAPQQEHGGWAGDHAWGDRGRGT